MNLSDEQKKYIFFNERKDTKLLATAGSGKTYCIIQHINYLINNKIFDETSIFMLTFSKNSKNDFINKITENKINLPKENIYTIDSFAWYILGYDNVKEIDVSILSFSLLEFLKTFNILISENPKIKQMQCLFVDEAQDLNETQYNILLCLKKITNSTLNLVGDPNQNIYQFRNASDKFLLNYPADTFYLTKNFRSKPHIVDFCSYLKPYDELKTTVHSQNNKHLSVMFYPYNSINSFEKNIINIIQFLISRKIALHKIAILAPTRGYIKNKKGATKYKGLCYISNLLFNNNIPFKQFYNDQTSDENSGTTNSKITYDCKKNFINLMTYTSSKGLEWDYVILIDANAFLINNNDYNEEKFKAEQYLLYVACSRAKKNLIVFAKNKIINPWFKNIPISKYKLAWSDDSTAAIDFYDVNKLYQNKNENQEQDILKKNISHPVNKLSDKQLYNIHNILAKKIKKQFINLNEHKITKILCVCKSKQNVASYFLVHLFFISCLNNPCTENLFLKDIQNIVFSKNIINCSDEYILQWYYKNRDSISWQDFEIKKSKLNSKIVEFVESRFDKSIPFSEFTVVDKFYDAFVSKCYDEIVTEYKNYTQNNISLENVLFLSLVSYAIKTTHYFYILQKDEFIKDIINTHNNKKNLFFFQHTIKKNFLNRINDIHKYVENESMYSFVDCFLNNEKVYIKSLDELGLKDIIKMLMILLMDENKSNKYIEINLNKLEMTCFLFDLSNTEMRDILTILQE